MLNVSAVNTLDSMISLLLFFVIIMDMIVVIFSFMLSNKNCIVFYTSMSACIAYSLDRSVNEIQCSTIYHEMLSFDFYTNLLCEIQTNKIYYKGPNAACGSCRLKPLIRIFIFPLFSFVVLCEPGHEMERERVMYSIKISWNALNDCVCAGTVSVFVPATVKYHLELRCVLPQRTLPIHTIRILCTHEIVNCHYSTLKCISAMHCF